MMLHDTLAELGIAVLGPVASVAKALALMEREADAIDEAVLDIDLGTENAYPIGDALAARGVPFLFLTGYGAAGVENRHQGVPVLTKPVDAGMLARTIEKITGNRPKRPATADQKV
jgi:FixJ family two-component response regulator